jgi:hypothetical protein
MAGGTVVLAAYSPSVFNDLDHFEDVRNQPESRADDISRLGEIIRKHGSQEWIGLILLHHHFRLQNNERLVASKNQTGVRIVPEVVSGGAELIPYSWTYRPGYSGGVWYPLEFVRPGDADVDVAARAERLAGANELLRDLADELTRLGLERLFGVSVLPEGHVRPGTDELSLETSSADGRALQVSACKVLDVNRLGLVQTLWRFTSGMGSDGAYCNHCSNHCVHCGYHQ